MNRKRLLLLLALNFLIAVSFFLKNIGVGYSQLSSDMQNIVPMCMKLDNPALYPHDLYLTDIENFKFYTPFFIETLRFIAHFTDYNYVQATNVLLLVSSFVFGVLWFFLLFRILKNRFWVALLISVLMRGIVWLPCGEIWGISDLWTIMPRTIYAALLPLPFLLLLWKKDLGFYLSAFLIGFIFNFHPISGLGGILAFLILVASLAYYKKINFSLLKIVYGLLLILLGMAPFIFTYFGKTDAVVLYDLALYEKAFDAKISSNYQKADLIFKAWLKLKFLFFLVPLLIFLIYTFWKSHPYKKQALLLVIISLSLFLLPVCTIFLERWVNSFFDINLRMSFQLVRIQKLTILPAYFAMGFLLVLISEKFPKSKRYFPLIFSGYSLILIISHLNIFNKVPFFGDDLSRSILPNYSEVLKPLNERKTDFDKMADYIKNNTPTDAVFFNNYTLRCAAKRSVKFDIKGANILVEGNPQKLIDWYLGRNTLSKRKGRVEMVTFLRNNDVGYVLSKTKWNTLRLLHSVNNLYLYKIAE